MMLAVIVAFLLMAQTPQSPPQIPEDVVQAALTAWNGARTNFSGIGDFKEDVQRLRINSARQGIARKAWEIVGTTAKYTPDAVMRHDTVTIICGNPERARRFECSRVTVLVEGREVKPILYLPENSEYQNGFGAKWNSQTVKASYPITGLEHGFTVQYADPSGVEWSFVVTAEAAEKELLLKLTPKAI